MYLLYLYIMHFAQRPIFEHSVSFILAVFSFICLVGSAMIQRSDLCGLRVKLLPVTTSLTTWR